MNHVDDQPPSPGDVQALVGASRKRSEIGVGPKGDSRWPVHPARHGERGWPAAMRSGTCSRPRRSSPLTAAGAGELLLRPGFQHVGDGDYHHPRKSTRSLQRVDIRTGPIVVAEHRLRRGIRVGPMPSNRRLLNRPRPSQAAVACSSDGIDHLLVTLGAMMAGIQSAPRVSVAYRCRAATTRIRTSQADRSGCRIRRDAAAFKRSTRCRASTS